VRDKSFDALARALDELVDPAIGIVQRIYEVAREPGSPDLFHYAAKAANTAAFGFKPNFANSGGASIDKAQAIAKAAGEAIERYCAAIYDIADFPLASADGLEQPAVNPASFALYTPEQYDSAGFPWAPFDAATPVRWTQVTDMRGGGLAFAPAAFVWIPYRYDPARGEAPIGQPISTGLACHGGPEEAMLSGLCEVVERDAFTLFWQARTSPPHIRVETLSDANYDLVRRFESTGDSVLLLNLTTDIGVTTVLSILRSPSSHRPAHVFAAATHVDPEAAVRKALEELAHTRRYSEQVLHLMPCPSPDNDFEEVSQQAHHLRLAADHQNIDRFAFVSSSEQRVDFQELPSLAGSCAAEDLSAAVAATAAVNLTPYVADLTSSDVRGLGFSVVRVLVPGVHPLFMGHLSRARGGSRLYEVPQKLGHSGLSPDMADNPFPHPYP
jgi:ribosomal protein S12 methylthiotransferase accessory factor